MELGPKGKVSLFTGGSKGLGFKSKTLLASDATLMYQAQWALYRNKYITVTNLKKSFSVLKQSMASFFYNSIIRRIA